MKQLQSQFVTDPDIMACRGGLCKFIWESCWELSQEFRLEFRREFSWEFSRELSGLQKTLRNLARF